MKKLFGVQTFYNTYRLIMISARLIGAPLVLTQGWSPSEPPSKDKRVIC